MLEMVKVRSYVINKKIVNLQIQMIRDGRLATSEEMTIETTWIILLLINLNINKMCCFCFGIISVSVHIFCYLLPQK